MSSAIAAADANRDFSKLLRRVRDGGSCVITSHGKPVARMIPIDGHDRVRAAARHVLMARLRTQPVTAAIDPWTRDDLYEE
jgi:prevent-host-death family protein